jgi:hypothetical protein
MGSRNSGKFSNFPPSNEKGGGGAGGRGTSTSGSRKEHSDTDRCLQDVDVALEEVGISEYFSAHADLPPVGTQVVLRQQTIGPRLSVDTAGESLGFLPTEYNYLVVCMEKGFTYSGEVLNATQTPLPSVRVSLRASTT